MNTFLKEEIVARMEQQLEYLRGEAKDISDELKPLLNDIETISAAIRAVKESMSRPAAIPARAPDIAKAGSQEIPGDVLPGIVPRVMRDGRRLYTYGQKIQILNALFKVEGKSRYPGLAARALGIGWLRAHHLPLDIKDRWGRWPVEYSGGGKGWYISRAHYLNRYKAQ